MLGLHTRRHLIVQSNIRHSPPTHRSKYCLSRIKNAQAIKIFFRQPPKVEYLGVFRISDEGVYNRLGKKVERIFCIPYLCSINIYQTGQFLTFGHITVTGVRKCLTKAFSIPNKTCRRQILTLSSNVFFGMQVNQRQKVVNLQ